MKRLTSFVRVGSLARWLKRLQMRATGPGSESRTVQGDTMLEFGPDYAFSGQVRAGGGGVRVLPFFWQPQYDALASTEVPTTASGASLLADPVISLPSPSCVICLVMDARIEAVTANAETNNVEFDRQIDSVQIQAHTTVPPSRRAEIYAQRGVIMSGGLPIPVFTITEVQSQARLVLPLATVRGGSVVHSIGLEGQYVHGDGLVLLPVPVDIFIEEPTEEDDTDPPTDSDDP